MSPSVEIGCCQDLQRLRPKSEALSLDVTKRNSVFASENVVALGRTDWVSRTTPTASSDEAAGRWMVVNYLLTVVPALPRHAAGPGLYRSPAHPYHSPKFAHSRDVLGPQ